MNEKIPTGRVTAGRHGGVLPRRIKHMQLHAFVAVILLATTAWPTAASIQNSLPGSNTSTNTNITIPAPIPTGDTELWRQRAAAGDAYAQWVMSARLLSAGPTQYQAALAALKQSAENGYAQAALDWGRVLLYGRLGTTADAGQGMRWIERAEQSGNAEAAYVLAEVYWNGWGVAADRDKSVVWLKRAAEKAWAPAREALGLILRDGFGAPQDAREAARWLELAAVQGRPEAKFALAELLATGQGMEHDDTRALRLYRELTKAGYLPAEQKAAAMIAEGRGETADSAPLRAVLEKSAQAGSVSAAKELAVGLLNGSYGPPERIAGLRWLERAAAANHPIAQFLLAEEGQAGAQRVQWLERAAQLGSTSAEFALGMAYAYGDGVPTDDRAAVKWYQRAAEKGHVAAQSSLGWRYLYGVTLTKDEVQALIWMRRAAAQGDTLSMGNLVRVLLTRADDTSRSEALGWIQRLAEAGQAQYQGVLAAIYSGQHSKFGTGHLDQAEALRWLKKAAAQGNGAAEVVVGNAYSDGHGVAVDVAQAIRSYERAAERGNKEADLNLARVYLFGRGGTAHKPDKVRFHLARAGLSDDPSIRKQAEDLRNPTLRWVDAKSQQYDWSRVRNDAEAGDREAQRLLGAGYLQGNLGLPKSLEKAYPWFLKAAAQGDPESMNNVGYTLYSGFLGPVDFVAARRWFEKAARAGFSNSMVSLARMNERGEAGKPNPKQALDWLLKAGEANNPQAIQWLAMLYRNGGLGQAVDPKRAAYWAARIVPADSKGKP